MLKIDPTDETCETWPAPALFSENFNVETPEIPCSLLPSWLGYYCQSITNNLQTPPGLAVMLGLAAVAACVQKRFEVELDNGYKEPLNIWALIALEPGSKKTSAKDDLTLPLIEWEQHQEDILSSEIRESRLQKDINDKLKINLTSKAAKPDLEPEEKERWIKMLREAHAAEVELITLPKVLADDTSAVGLQELMANNGERIAVLSDEGGVFETLSSLSNKNINVFLQSHAGASIRVKRLSRHVELQRPALTIGLAVQPQIVSNLAKGKKTSWRGNGFLDRFLYCIPGNSYDIGDVSIQERDSGAYGEYFLAITALLDIKPSIINGREVARPIRLDNSALKVWEQFRNHIKKQVTTGQELEPISGWAKKLAGAALRIAGLCHIVEYIEPYSDDPDAEILITQKTMERAVELATLLVRHAQAAFEIVGGGQAVIDAIEVFKWLVDGKTLHFKQSDVYRELRRFKELSRLKAAIQVLVDRNIISDPIKIKSSGRPTILYKVNPRIF